MKKFILDFLLFGLVFAILYCISVFVWTNYAPKEARSNVKYPIGAYGHLNSRLKEVKGVGEVEILFLGSSHAYRGFDNRIFESFGFRSFNLGSSAQTPIQTKVLLRRYLDHLNPNFIIYEVYPEMFMMDGIESGLDIIANDHNDFFSLQMVFQLGTPLLYNSFIYGVICDFFELNRDFSEPIQKGSDKYVSGGYVEKELGYFEPVPLVSKEIIPFENQLASFIDIIEVLKKRNKDLLLVFAPIPKINYQRYKGVDDFDSLMSSCGSYVNANKLMNLNDSLHFQDDNHLNQTGVELFNRKLIEEVLPDYLHNW